MAGNRTDWQEVGKPLGSGGQSEVHLVRSPERVKKRTADIQQITSFNPWGITTAETRLTSTGEFADAVSDYGRVEDPSEFGAMKVFKIRPEDRDQGQQALNRLRQEIEVLQWGRPGLPKLLDFNLDERWMVTEYFPRGTLEANYSMYKGKPTLALKAFLSLVKTVAALHQEGVVHRDIKPANVFIRADDDLVLGDFGIVFLPNRPTRMTCTQESVGPHDYMPPWAEVEGRLTNVQPNFDIYMLGKLLWCMVSGRLRLQREWFERRENNLTVIFQDDPAMHMINVILKQCVVEDPERCKTSATDLTSIVATYLQILERGGQLLHKGISRPCRVCGLGHYQTEGYARTQPPLPTNGAVGLRLSFGTSASTLPVYPYVCDSCGHVEFFTCEAPSGNESC